MKRLVVLVVCLAAAGAANACIWSYGTSLRGETIEVDGVIGESVVQGLKDQDTRAVWEAEERKHAARARANPNHEVRNDHAVTLLHLGRTKEALALLLENERVRPGAYVTAANLGTAYELAGDDAAALRWITEGIRRNRDAHGGTEWLHVRILDAKIAMAADPRWLDTHSILGIDFGGAVIPKLPQPLPKGNTGEPVSLANLNHALWYQLNERYQFVKPPDRVVAQLLFEWANVQFRTESLETAAALYREALRYGLNRDLAKSRLERAEQTLRDHTVRQKK